MGPSAVQAVRSPTPASALNLLPSFGSRQAHWADTAWKSTLYTGTFCPLLNH